MDDTRRAVLEAIAAGPVTGPALAEDLDVSRTAVWKHVEALREAGFEVDSAADGYVLGGIPEFGPGVEFGLEAPFSIEYHDQIASTNDRARDLAEEGAADVVVLADEQTGGRGRHARPWASPSGGVWMSLVLRPDLPASHVPVLTLAAAVATAKAAREVGVDARLKWPNDVIVPNGADGSHDGVGGERKLAGILTEMAGETERVYWVVIGIGVNANVDPAALPSEATSLKAQKGDVDRRRVVQALLEKFDELRSDPDRVLPAWRELALTLGREVRVESSDGSVVGEAVDVVFPGHLVVETGEESVRIHAGDCEHLRPA